MVTQSPSQRTRSQARDPRSVALSPRADGSFGALSSDGVTLYSVRPVADTWQCQCPGYAARQTCCHSLAAAQAAACYWCGHVGADVETFSNGWDGGSDLALCTACSPVEPDACPAHRAGCPAGAHSSGEAA
jgi:hypothetical protein